MNASLNNTNEQTKNYVEPVMNNLRSFFLNTSGLKDYTPRPSDIVINTYPKAGNVILQQMCYQIAVLSGGAPSDDPTGMDFDDIGAAVPWLDQKVNLNFPDSLTTPRILKSHLPVNSFQPGASKHIVITRNPLQFPASFLNFMFPAFHPNLTAHLSDDVKQSYVDYLFEHFLLEDLVGDGVGTWHTHLKRSLTHTDNVMIVFYEDVVSDMKGAVEKIARFMDCTLTDQDVHTIVRRCDRQYMSTDPKFDGHFERKVFGFPSNPIHVFGENYVGFKKYKVSTHLIDALERMNIKVFGLRTYEEIKKKIASEQKVTHNYY